MKHLEAGSRGPLPVLYRELWPRSAPRRVEWAALASQEHEITVEIVCTRLPGKEWDERSDVHLGIQRNEEVIESAPASSKRIVFQPVLRVRQNADGSPNFLGPFAHGPKAERFIYLVWTAAAAGFGRVKVHLNHLKWADVEQALARKKPIRVTLELTRSNGKPVYASVRPGAAKWEL